MRMAQTAKCSRSGFIARLMLITVLMVDAALQGAGSARPVAPGAVHVVVCVAVRGIAWRQPYHRG